MREDRIAAALTWAATELGAVELHLLKRRPWAVTWRAERPDATVVFVKCSTARTGHEAALLIVLRRACPDLVPDLVAADPEQHRLIVASAGSVLRQLNGNGTFDLAVWVPLVQRFAELQLRVRPHLNELLEQGVPDERPERYPELLRAFTSAQQLPGAERDRLKALADDWDRNGTGLPASTVPLSIQHGDLHDNNVAVDAAGVYRFFDFGDSTVAHPFSTMDLPLQFARDAGVDEAGIARLEDAYLEAFTEFAPRNELRRELRAVIALAPLQRAHAWARALGVGEIGSLAWDPVAAAEWGRPIEYWLARLRR